MSIHDDEGKHPMIKYNVPSPIIDLREKKSLDKVTRDYEKMLEPGPVQKAGDVIARAIPGQIKTLAGNMGAAISQAEMYKWIMDYVVTAYAKLEEQAAKYTIDENSVCERLNKIHADDKICSLDEVCLMREYDISKAVNDVKNWNLGFAAVEGGATGAVGLVGLIPNLATSTFLYFRAVQNMAMMYGYDVRNDSEEMEIASAVLMNAMSPGFAGSGDLSTMIGKIMVAGEMVAVKQAAKKGWTAMAQHAGLPLLMAQMRALANNAAKKAVQNAGRKTLEKTVYTNVLEQVGRKLTLKTAQRAVPIIGGVIGAGLDAYQMNVILDYAEKFYRKRFLVEKEERIIQLTSDGIAEAVDVSVEEH